MRNGRRLLVENGADGVGFCRLLKRTLTHNHLVKDGAESENIGPLVSSESADLFGRHVSDRAQGYARHSDSLCGSNGTFLRGQHLGQPEVENLDASALGDEHIIGLEIAMDDSFFMRGS